MKFRTFKIQLLDEVRRWEHLWRAEQNENQVSFDALSISSQICQEAISELIPSELNWLNLTLVFKQPSACWQKYIACWRARALITMLGLEARHFNGVCLWSCLMKKLLHCRALPEVKRERKKMAEKTPAPLWDRRESVRLRRTCRTRRVWLMAPQGCSSSTNKIWGHKSGVILCFCCVLASLNASSNHSGSHS